MIRFLAAFLILLHGTIALSERATGIDAFRETFFPGSGNSLENPRAKRYVSVFDRSVSNLKARFDFEKGLLAMTGAMPPPEIAKLDRWERKKHTGGEYQWLYSLGRSSAEAIGAFGLAWALPGSIHEGEEALRSGVVAGISSFLDNQSEEGEFVFSSIRFSSVYGTHEMAWRLEPLLAAYLCVRHTLPQEQNQRFYEGLHRAAEYLYNTPCTSQTNRGCVWAGVMALAARIFEEPKYLELVKEHWSWIGGRVFSDSGQVIEGPGPDMIYSFVSFRYTFLQRLASGNEDLDPPLMKSLDWLISMHDSKGLPMQSVCTRLGIYTPVKLAFLESALEFYSRERPYYATVAGRFLDILEEEEGDFAAHGGGLFWVAAALYHDPKIQAEPEPERLLRFTDLYSYDVTQYLNIRRDYQTLVLFSGVKDLAGLQHWSLEGEPPVLFEIPGRASTLQAWGIDTSRIKLQKGWRTDSSDLDTASMDWGGIRTCYVFGERATWVFNVAPGVKRELRWAINGKRCAQPSLEGQTILFEGQKSCIHIGPTEPRLEETQGGWFVCVDLSEEVAIDWTVFHDGQAGPVEVELADGLMKAHLEFGSECYHLIFNYGGESKSGEEWASIPLQAWVGPLDGMQKR